MPLPTSRQERVPCRACGFGVMPTASFCFICKAPDPVLTDEVAPEKATATSPTLPVGRGFFATALSAMSAILGRRSRS